MTLRKHFNLTASTHASVTLTARTDTTTTNDGVYVQETHRLDRKIRRVTIINHDASSIVYYRFNGTAPTAAGADDDWVLPARASWVHEFGKNTVQFVLVSTGTPRISIIGES